MSKKLTEQKLFNPLIKWIDSFYDTVENTSLFKEDDELMLERDKHNKMFSAGAKIA